MIVVSIIAIMTAVVGVNYSASGEASRDAKRQSDLRAIQTALEAYKNRVGRYPAQCAVPATAGGWSGQLGTIYQCDNIAGNVNGQYIVGLAPEYIPVLPIDPKLNGTNSGYVYRTNAAGTVYKLMAMNTVEGETVRYTHKLSSCHIIPGVAGTDVRTSGWCTGAHYNSYNRPAVCTEANARFQTSYGVWGGIAPYFSASTVSLDALANNTVRMSEIRNTTDVICR
jgi:type II secretory pathway pseudopilin PulG